MTVYSAFSVFAAAFALGAAPAPAQERYDPIRLSSPRPNTSAANTQYIALTVLEEVLKAGGYKVEHHYGDFSSESAGLAAGTLHLKLEPWMKLDADAYPGQPGKPDDALGPTGVTFRSGWWYPSYLAEACPGLPDWKALKQPACAQALSTAETAPDGSVLLDSGTYGGNRLDYPFVDYNIKALDLPFEVTEVASITGLYIRLDSAYQKRQPFIVQLTSPSWITARYQGEMVQFPQSSFDCIIDITDASGGPNPDTDGNCNWPTIELWKVGWPGLKEKWPDAYKTMTAFTLDNETMGELVAQVDIEGKTAEEVALRWMAENETVWKGWLAR